MNSQMFKSTLKTDEGMVQEHQEHFLAFREEHEFVYLNLIEHKATMYFTKYVQNIERLGIDTIAEVL